MSNSPTRRWVKRIYTSLLEAHARLAGKGFYCLALQGRAEFNSISVNCDMTVSCFDHDHDGSGLLGDLSSQSLEELLDGPAAAGRRQALAQGRLPTSYCCVCKDLRRAPRADARAAAAIAGPPKKGLLVENTIACQLRCKCCDRLRLHQLRAKKSLDMADVARIAEFLRDNGVEQLSWFKFGEPFCHPEIHDQLSLIRRLNPGIYVRLSTNALALTDPARREAALLADYIEVSLDGVDTAMVERYQVGNDFDVVYENMTALARLRDARGLSRPHIEWKYIVFNFNDRPEHIQRAISLAKEAGCDAITFWPAKVPLVLASVRYRLHPFYRKLGIENEKGRTVTLRDRSAVPA